MDKVEDSAIRQVPSGFEISHDSGSLSVHEIAPGVILQEYESGVIDDYFNPVAELGDRRIREGLRVTLVSDITRSRSHTTSYRRAWSEWIKAHEAHVDEVLVLLNSPMQRMAVNAANLATGGLFRAFTDVEQFQAAVEAAVLRAESAAALVSAISPTRARDWTGSPESLGDSVGPETPADSINAEVNHPKDGAGRVATIRLHATYPDDSHSQDHNPGQGPPSPGPHSIAGHPSVGTVLQGAYRLDQRIGKGGMGMVYRGTQLSLERAVAVKLIRLDRRHSPEAFARFRREIDLVSRLSHPNIVQVIDAGSTEAGVSFLVMELLDGHRLDRFVGRTGLEVSVAVDLYRQLCAGIGAAHAEGLIHRDLSPANVFVRERKDSSLELKILDFGLAKATSDSGELTLNGQILGTPGFMAPEQIDHSHDVDVRADIYSITAVLYFMLTGRRPFVGKSAAATIALQLKGQFAPLLPEHACFLPVLQRGLALDPDERPASVSELLSAFEAAAAKAPDPLRMRSDLLAKTGATGRRGRLRHALPWILVAGAIAATAGVLALQSC